MFSEEEKAVLLNQKYKVPEPLLKRITPKSRVLIPHIGKLRFGMESKDWDALLQILSKTELTGTEKTKVVLWTSDEQSLIDTLFPTLPANRYSNFESMFLCLCHLMANPEGEGSAMFCRIGKRKNEGAGDKIRALYKAK